jgi:hypothetical protein
VVYDVESTLLCQRSARLAVSCLCRGFMLTSGQLAPCIIRRSFFLHGRSRSITFSLQSINRFQHTQNTQNQKPALRENIYTFPNLLTVSRIVACPALGWAILSDNYTAATGLLLYAGVTDWVSRRDRSPPLVLMMLRVPVGWVSSPQVPDDIGSRDHPRSCRG